MRETHYSTSLHVMNHANDPVQLLNNSSPSFIYKGKRYLIGLADFQAPLLSVNGTPTACGRKAQGSGRCPAREKHTDFLSPNSSVLEKTSVGLIWSVLKSLLGVMTLAYLLSKETSPSRGSLFPLLRALSLERPFLFLAVALRNQSRERAVGRRWDGPGRTVRGSRRSGRCGGERCPLGPWGLRVSSRKPLAHSHHWFVLLVSSSDRWGLSPLRLSSSSASSKLPSCWGLAPSPHPPTSP